jgi:glycogen debranching enzyme
MAVEAGKAGAGSSVSPFYISATETLATYRPHVLKRDDCFVVLDPLGNAQATGPSAEGLFFEDTRYVSQLVLTIDGHRPLLLSSSVNAENAVLGVDLTNPDLMAEGRLQLARDSVHILSSTVLGESALFTELELRNFERGPAAFALALHFEVDFVDLFEVRGSSRRRRGERLPDQRVPDGIVLGYRGLDKVERRTRFTFERMPDRVEPRCVTWMIELPPGERHTIRITARCLAGERPAAPLASREASLAALARRNSERQTRAAHLYSNNESFNDLTNRSRADLDMLVSETPHGLYPYAGIPWFSTAFGRDGLITALECLWLDPALAAGTLRYLAARQATKRDPASDAEPGKILHETRGGEMALLGEVPFRCYYGSVDATPLFVVLAAAYYARTGDLELVRALWDNIEAALRWMAEYGDLDRDGFLEYDRKSVNGLVNQGWKDSGDAISHADGRLAEAPIALAEVQAYAYAAYLGASSLAQALNDTPRAAELAVAAERLRQRFEAAFWCEDIGTYALALDRDKRPCKVKSSNAGQVLLSGMAAPERAARVARTLMAPQGFSGWGVRTLAEGEARYNPMSYHNGSVWPHDNALIAMGFARYGLRRPTVQLLTGMFDAAQFIELKRLPELYCGFARREGTGPTGYPVACQPQAWASASVFAVLGALLGISFDAQRPRISLLRPTLPPWLDTLHVSNLRLGAASVDLVLERRDDDVALHVPRRQGDVEIVLTT